MEESTTEQELVKRPPGLWRRATRGILDGTKGVIDAFASASKQTDSRSAELDDVHQTTIDEAGASTLEGDIIVTVWRWSIVDILKEEKTPKMLQPEEYSLLALSLAENLLPEAQNQMTEYTKEQAQEAKEEVAEILQRKKNWLWGLFCQKNNLDSENEAAKKHLEFINQTARDIFLRQHNQKSINMAEVFQNIQQDRQTILTLSV